MRPTLIQQKPVFGQEPAAGVQPAALSGSESYGIWFGVFLAGMICAIQILQCGVVRGLGQFAFPVFVCLAPWVFVLFCFLVCGPMTGGGGWNLWTRMPWLEMVGASGLTLGMFYLPHLAFVFGILLFFLALSPKCKLGRWNRPAHMPRAGLIGVAVFLIGVYLLPQFVTRNRLPWLIPGRAPAGWSCLHAMPPVTGTWEGRFSSKPALLVVTSQHWQKFDGELLVRSPGYTYKIAVQGTLNRSGAVDIHETQVLDESFYHDWAPGIDTGTWEFSALEMHGHGVDTRGSRYHWGFEHVSSAIYIPEN